MKYLLLHDLAKQHKTFERDEFFWKNEDTDTFEFVDDTPENNEFLDYAGEYCSYTSARFGFYITDDNVRDMTTEEIIDFEIQETFEAKEYTDIENWIAFDFFPSEDNLEKLSKYSRRAEELREELETMREDIKRKYEQE